MEDVVWRAIILCNTLCANGCPWASRGGAYSDLTTEDGDQCVVSSTGTGTWEMC